MFKYTSMIIYIVSTALSLVAINQFESHINPSVVAFFSFLICFLFFNLINGNRYKTVYSVLFKKPIHFISINIITAIIWLGTFWGLKYITPALFVCIFMSAIPVTSVLINPNKKALKIRPILILFVLIFSALGIISYESMKGMHFTEMALYGIILAALSGIFSAIYMHYSQKMQKEFRFRTIDFLCIRFYLVIAICFFLIMHNHTTISISHNWYDFLIISALTTIIPLYSLQDAILKLGPMQTSCLITFTPLAAYFFEMILGFQFNLLVFGTMVIMTILLMQHYRILFSQRER